MAGYDYEFVNKAGTNSSTNGWSGGGVEVCRELGSMIALDKQAHFLGGTEYS